MASPRIILVTGSNDGIGLAIVRQLAKEGHTVYLTARTSEKGNDAIAKLKSENVTARFVQLEVTDQASVDAAAAKIASESGHLDVLVNNAAIFGSTANALNVKLEEVREVYETNFFGVIRVTNAFLPLLKKSNNPVITNITSFLGSTTSQSTPGTPGYNYQIPAYNSGKAALNHYTITLASAFPEARVNVISPGFVKTKMNGYTGVITVEESAAGIIKNGVLIKNDGPTGKFLDYTNENKPIPW